MLTSIHIQGFKGFRDTKIPELRRVNLIVGGQNSGKTSLLEAIHVSEFTSFESTDSPSVDSLVQSGFRVQPRVRIAPWLNTDVKHEFTVKALPIDFYSLRSYSVYPPLESEMVQLYDLAVFSKTKNRLINLLAEIEPRLVGIESITPSQENNPVLHADITGLQKLIPFSMLGQGFNRLAYLYAGLLGQNANIALIDEIENGIHYSALPILWQGIANIARELDIQIFATTHSYECIQAAAKVFEATPEEFQLIRLERTDDNNIKPVLIRDENLAVVLESNWEIR